MLNLKTIASRDVTMKVFGNQVLQEKIGLVDVKSKCTEKTDILIRCLVKDICQPLTGKHISQRENTVMFKMTIYPLTF